MLIKRFFSLSLDRINCKWYCKIALRRLRIQKSRCVLLGNFQDISYKYSFVISDFFITKILSLLSQAWWAVRFNENGIDYHTIADIISLFLSSALMITERIKFYIYHWFWCLFFSFKCTSIKWNILSSNDDQNGIPSTIQLCAGRVWKIDQFPRCFSEGDNTIIDSSKEFEISNTKLTDHFETFYISFCRNTNYILF